MTRDPRVIIYVIALIISSILGSIVFVLLWRRRRSNGALPLALMILSVVEWSITSAFEAVAITIPEKLFWSKAGYLGITSSAPLLFLFAMQYIRQIKRKSPVITIVVWIVPFAMFLLAATNEMHHLIWSSVSFLPGSTILIYSHGIGFMIGMAYIYVIIAISSTMLIISAIRNRNIYRTQAITILVGIPIPVLYNLLYIFGKSPLTGFDLTPVAFGLTGIILSWGIYRNKLFDLAPIGREHVIDTLPDGVITLDDQLRVVDLNEAAAEILDLDSKKTIGTYILNHLPRLTDLENHIESKSELQVINAAGTTTHIEIRSYPLKDNDDEFLGYSIFLRDVSESRKAEEALLESEKRYRSLLDNAVLPVVILDQHSLQVLYSNERTKHLFEITENDHGRLVIDSHFENKNELYRILRIAQKNQMVTDYEAPMLTINRRKIWVLVSANQTQFEQRDALFLSFNEITSRKLVEESERQQRLFAEALRDSVTALNSSLKFDEVLDHILDSLEKVVPYTYANIMQVDDRGSARVVRARGYDAAGLEKVTKTATQIVELPTLLKMAVNGSPLLIRDTARENNWIPLDGMEWIRSYLGAPILVKGKVVGYINLDSTRPNVYDSSHVDRLQIFAHQAAIAIENSSMFTRLEQMAIADPLTGLYNRRYFYDLGEREVERNKRYNSPLSLLMIDLDHFKNVNDRFGHDAGDKVLQEMALLFSGAMRKMDIPGRIGGEEFVILLPETQLEGARLVGERLRQAIESAEIKFGGETIKITASVGVSTVTTEMISLQALINAADKAMYQAKSAGRNTVVTS